MTIENYYEFLCGLGMRAAAEEAKIRIEIIEAAKNGASISDIAMATRLSRHKISDVIGDLGITVKRRSRPKTDYPSSERDIAIIEDRKKGLKGRALCRKYGIGMSNLYNILSRAGAVRLKRETPHYCVDPEFDDQE